MMLLKEARKMKRKGSKLKKNEAVSAKKSTVVGTSPLNSDASNSSYLTDVDPSEIEVIHQRDFEYQSDDPAEEVKPMKNKRKKGKVHSNLNPSQDYHKLPNAADSVSRKAVLGTHKMKKKKKTENVNAGRHTENNTIASSKVGKFITLPMSSDISQKTNIGTLKPKKKKKQDIGASNGKMAGSKKSKIASAECENKTQKSVKLTKGARSTEMSIAERDKKVGKKRNIDSIFEEAEMHVGEAVPKKIDEVKKMLMKGAKSAGPSNTRERREQKEKPEYEDLSFKKPRVSVDESLLETTDEGISSGLSGSQKVLDRVNKMAVPHETKLPDIDPNKFIPVKTQKLRTVVPVFEEGGDSESDDEEQQRMNLMEAFADDDIVDEFRKEKEDAEEESKPKTVDLRLPGWGSWGGIGINPEKKKRWNGKRNQLTLKFPGVPRKDQGKTYVIINDDPPASFKKQLVDDLPSEFPSVAAYEASIRAPIGTTWVPEAAHRALTAPPVTTKMGAIIRPLDETHLIKEDAEKEAQKRFNDSFKGGKPPKRFKRGNDGRAGHSRPEGGGSKKGFRPPKKQKNK